jgi:hypothetical protein
VKLPRRWSGPLAYDDSRLTINILAKAGTSLENGRKAPLLGRTHERRSGSKTMRKLKKDDACEPEERALGWYYYLENRLRFPFGARCIATSQSRYTAQQQKVRPPTPFAWHPKMPAPPIIRWQGRTIAVPFVPTGRSQFFGRVLEGQGVGRFR